MSEFHHRATQRRTFQDKLQTSAVTRLHALPSTDRASLGGRWVGGLGGGNSGDPAGSRPRNCQPTLTHADPHLLDSTSCGPPYFRQPSQKSCPPPPLPGLS